MIAVELAAEARDLAVGHEAADGRAGEHVANDLELALEVIELGLALAALCTRVAVVDDEAHARRARPSRGVRSARERRAHVHGADGAHQLAPPRRCVDTET